MYAITLMVTSVKFDSLKIEPNAIIVSYNRKVFSIFSNKIGVNFDFCKNRILFQPYLFTSDEGSLFRNLSRHIATEMAAETISEGCAAQILQRPHFSSQNGNLRKTNRCRCDAVNSERDRKMGNFRQNGAKKSTRYFFLTRANVADIKLKFRNERKLFESSIGIFEINVSLRIFSVADSSAECLFNWSAEMGYSDIEISTE